MYPNEKYYLSKSELPASKTGRWFYLNFNKFSITESQVSSFRKKKFWLSIILLHLWKNAAFD